MLCNLEIAIRQCCNFTEGGSKHLFLELIEIDFKHEVRSLLVPFYGLLNCFFGPTTVFVISQKCTQKTCHSPCFALVQCQKSKRSISIFYKFGDQSYFRVRHSKIFTGASYNYSNRRCLTAVGTLDFSLVCDL